MLPSYLIVNADDGFYCEKRDLGIVQGMRNGAITSVSVMMNGFVAKQLCSNRLSGRSSARTTTITSESCLLDYLKSNHKIPGIHVNLSEGSPLSTNCQSLLSATNRNFHGKFQFHKLATQHPNALIPHDIQNEIEAQVECFIELFGANPTHIDGHHHTHILPGVFSSIISTMHKYDIAYCRLPIESAQFSSNPRKFESMISPENIDLYRKISQFSIEGARMLTDARLNYTMFLGMTTMGKHLNSANLDARFTECINDYATLFRSIDESQLNTQFLELMVHPGHVVSDDWIDKAGCCEPIGDPDLFSQSAERQHELDFLSSKSFTEFLVKHKLTLSDFPKP